MARRKTFMESPHELDLGLGEVTMQRVQMWRNSLLCYSMILAVKDTPEAMERARRTWNELTHSSTDAHEMSSIIEHDLNHWTVESVKAQRDILRNRTDWE